jgi:porin
MRGVKLPLLAVLVVGAFVGAQAKDQPKAPPSIWDQDTLTGDWGGARTALKDKGIDVTLNYIDEVFGVLSGGLNRRASYEGRFEFSVDTDLQKLVGWSGASTHVTVYNIHNGGHTAAENASSIADPSNIDAVPTTRLFTAWFQYGATDGPFSLRVGQLAADDEFIISPTAGGLVNGTFGWAGILAANIRSGGPAYPLATPGARVQVKPSDNVTILGAVFSGDPAGRYCFNNPQFCNKDGTTFSFSGGSLWIGEVQYGINQGKGAMGAAMGLPGVYKLGVWYATADYADMRYGVSAAGGVVSLADPTATGPLNRHGNGGVYAVADQMVWRAGERSLNLFARSGVAPADRNTLSYYVDGGAGFKGLLPGRANDVLTFGVAYEKISSALTGLDQDTLFFGGPPYPTRNYEVVFELNYALQLAPWWTLQPDLQYIVHPGGNVPDPADPTNATVVKNAFIAGIRSTIKF